MKIIKEHYWAVIIFVIGILLRLYAAYMDSFLHEWDERFHALVARNMMNKPFHPLLLKNPFVASSAHNWSTDQLWLHKQPLFMWQMATSMKLFGVSEFTMRLPSVLMGALMLLLLYRITLILTGNKTTSTIAALLLCFSNYQLQLISGIEGMDHNDLAFDFYMLASCWAYAEYSINKKWYWIVLIGIFSGCAILNKWLVGLAVFLGWGINILFKFYKTKSITEIGWMLLSLVVCAAVFIPWQCYCYSNWPHEFITEMKFNTRHITEVLEGHDGPMSYYYDARDLFVGKYLAYLVPIGILFFIRDKKNNVEVLISICSIFLFVFIFYSFVVLTKVHSHFFFVIPFVLIFIANAVSKIFFQSKIIITKIAIIIVMIYLSINPNYFIYYLSKENKHRESCIQNAILYRNMDKLIPTNCKIVMNTHQLENINIMFYHPEIRVNDSCIGNADLSICATKKEWIAVFPDHNDFKLSTQILKYPYLFKIKTELK